MGGSELVGGWQVPAGQFGRQPASPAGPAGARARRRSILGLDHRMQQRPTESRRTGKLIRDLRPGQRPRLAGLSGKCGRFECAPHDPQRRRVTTTVGPRMAFGSCIPGNARAISIFIACRWPAERRSDSPHMRGSTTALITLRMAGGFYSTPTVRGTFHIWRIPRRRRRSW